MSDDKKSEDWEMSMPHQPLDEEVREIVENAGDPDHDGYGPTEATINLEPLNPNRDEWAMDDSRKTTEDKISDWQMPEPVFRNSPGETPHFDESGESGFGDIGREPQAISSIAAPPTAASANLPAPAPSRGTGKFAVILIAVFLLFAVAAAIIVVAYFLWFRGSGEVSSVSKNSSPASSSPKSAATPDSQSGPQKIELRGEMLLVDAGEFTMGSDTGPDESKPAHQIKLEAFYIDRFEVTNSQYKEFCDATGHPYPMKQQWDETYFSARPNAPVVGVTYDDAKAYAEWAGKRLPTEAEWEKAASWNESKKKKLAFPWGDLFETPRAAFGVVNPTDVGTYPLGASPYGALDMAGNALEWVDGYFDAYPGNTSSHPEFGKKNRIVRGGFMASKTDDLLRTTKRIFVPHDFGPSDDRDSFIGFRCAISANDPKIADRVR